jgi:cell filamentation protein
MPVPSLRYRDPSGAEGAFEPGSRSRVLANLKGITSKRAMDLAEYEALIAAQKAYYRQLTPETRFTADLLREMHRDWLGELYVWAGAYRTVELQKDDFVWPPAWRVPDNMLAYERDTLARFTPCRPADDEVIVEAMAVVHSELLLIHPFRDGNGRLARWLTDLMAVQAGLPVPDYALSGRGSVERRQRYVAAVRQGYVRNYRPLAGYFLEAVRRARR